MLNGFIHKPMDAYKNFLHAAGQIFYNVPENFTFLNLKPKILSISLPTRSRCIRTLISELSADIIINFQHAEYDAHF